MSVLFPGTFLYTCLRVEKIYFKHSRLCLSPASTLVNLDTQLPFDGKTQPWLPSPLTSRFSPFPAVPMFIGVRINSQFIFLTLQSTFHLPHYVIISVPGPPPLEESSQNT